MDEDLIARSVTEATIHAPLATVDLTDWVFTITDAEYQACSKNHIAAAASRTSDGKRMSLNVEHVGNLMVQHYVENISERTRCRLVSTSDSFGPDISSRTRLTVVWSFSAEAIDAGSTKFANTVEVRSTMEWLEALKSRGVTLAEAREAVGAAVRAHNAEETPLFAKDIERKAITGRWTLTAVEPFNARGVP
jgi:hypothetical protein